MRTHPLHSLTGVVIATFVASLTLAACDENGDDPTPCDGDDCEDDEMVADDDGEDAADDDANDDAASSAETAPPAAEGGSVSAECESLCTCVEGLGGNRSACGQQCNGDMIDGDPNDRAQCVEGLGAVGFMDCAVECEEFPDGT
jgi:hypothetical protein